MSSFADLHHQTDLLNGYVEARDSAHPDGNVTKIWAELDPPLQGRPWCAGGASWLWKHAGHPYPAIDKPYGFVYCPDAVTWAKRHGLWDTSGHYTPGDTIFYAFDAHAQAAGYAEHVETVISDDGTHLLTFGCNTLPDSGGAGSEWNGGGAYYRHRAHGPQVLGVLKSSRWLTTPAPPHPPAPTRPNPYRQPVVPPDFAQGCASDTASGSPRVHYTQWAIGVPCDGVFGPITDHALRMFQHYHGLVADGIVGPKTLAALTTIHH